MAGRRINCSYLHEQSDGATLVHFQDFTVLGPHQDVAVAKRYGTYRGVVLQKQPCGVTSSQYERAASFVFLSKSTKFFTRLHSQVGNRDRYLWSLAPRPTS